MAFYRVSPQDQKAFRARLRHLRNLGVPSVEKVGKGTQLTYTRKHLWQIYLALELTKLGVSPGTAALAADQMGVYFEEYMVRIDCEQKKRFLLIFNISEFGSRSDEATDLSMMLLSSKEYADDIAEGYSHYSSYLVVEFSFGIRGVEGGIS